MISSNGILLIGKSALFKKKTNFIIKSEIFKIKTGGCRV